MDFHHGVTTWWWYTVNVSLTETSGGGTRKFPLKRGIWMWLGPSLSVLEMCFREVRLHLKNTYVIHRLGSRYWEKLRPRSWVPLEAVLRPRDLKVSGKFASVSNLCVLKKGALVLMFKARDRLQTKTKHYNMIFELVIYIITIKLSFRIKKCFCVLVYNS